MELGVTSGVLSGVFGEHEILPDLKTQKEDGRPTDNTYYKQNVIKLLIVEMVVYLLPASSLMKQAYNYIYLVL